MSYPARDQPLFGLPATCYKYFVRFLVRGIRIVVVRHLAKVEARVRFPYPAPVFPQARVSFIPRFSHEKQTQLWPAAAKLWKDRIEV
jgi:hypothetical protein